MIDYTDYMILPCGGVAYYDEPNHGMNYFCAQCDRRVCDMSEACKREEDKWYLIEMLGGKGWDYFAEPDEF